MGNLEFFISIPVKTAWLWFNMYDTQPFVWPGVDFTVNVNLAFPNFMLSLWLTSISAFAPLTLLIIDFTPQTKKKKKIQRILYSNLWTQNWNCKKFKNLYFHGLRCLFFNFSTSNGERQITFLLCWFHYEKKMSFTLNFLLD